jgi:glyoxylase-like metal-dependent hydrolase (beta-lactamase superfamily II)
MSPEAHGTAPEAGGGGRAHAPAPLPDTAAGPDPAPGRLDVVAPGLARMTAPNPGVMTGPGTNTYLLGAGGAADLDRKGAAPVPRIAVVDPGPDDPSHLDAVAEAAEGRGGRVAWVLVTHTHPDHAPGAARLAALTGAEVVGFGPRDGFSPDLAVGDGWTLETPAFRLRALHTPGHASDHLCYVVDLVVGARAAPLRRVVLTGDHVMDRVTVVISPPDGDMAAYLASLERLRGLDPPADALAPGHGRLLLQPAAVVEAVLAHRLAREALVADALARAGSASLDGLVPLVYGDVAASLHPIARRSLWAHLRKLVSDGRAVEEPPEGSLVFRSRRGDA